MLYPVPNSPGLCPCGRRPIPSASALESASLRAAGGSVEEGTPDAMHAGGWGGGGEAPGRGGGSCFNQERRASDLRKGGFHLWARSPRASESGGVETWPRCALGSLRSARLRTASGYPRRAVLRDCGTRPARRKPVAAARRDTYMSVCIDPPQHQPLAEKCKEGRDTASSVGGG